MRSHKGLLVVIVLVSLFVIFWALRPSGISNTAINTSIESDLKEIYLLVEAYAENHNQSLPFPLSKIYSDQSESIKRLGFSLSESDFLKGIPPDILGIGRSGVDGNIILHYQSDILRPNSSEKLLSFTWGVKGKYFTIYLLHNGETKLAVSE